MVGGPLHGRPSGTTTIASPVRGGRPQPERQAAVRLGQAPRSGNGAVGRLGTPFQIKDNVINSRPKVNVTVTAHTDCDDREQG
ncbi:hypothetical protein AXG93_4316s1330 [Marchantia polymorpha subsp. ruderalis]|uniref:Uncharacterized protein n=1 Tax=Marchantia polymorpha subsp. ruderalis TaxID=1480154 RepID=A0A176VS07_MARPO|nr:hypothetical protein AXG93_4316s1330 [Marchantia polymorpha subsp. ruderalis]